VASYADPDGDTRNDGAIIFTPGLMFYIQGSNKIGFNLDVFWLTILEAILIETPAVEDSW
jgi:hypothetical protein